MRLAISLGGSVFTEALENGRGLEYAEVLDDLAQISGLTVVVVGAGSKKKRIPEAETENQVERDLLGVAATRENAETLLSLCEQFELSCAGVVPTSIAELKQVIEEEDPGVVVMGGTEPGHSTDTVAALAAELIGADRFLKATDVDGIYPVDPDTDSDAEKYDELTYTELVELLCDQEISPGSYSLFDLTAAKLVQRSQIPTAVVNGEPVNIIRAVHGKHVGTRIVGEESW